MKYPKFLSKNISLIAPSFGCTTEPYKTRLESAINIFKNKGYTINIYDNCAASILPYRSNTSLSCANEFISSYRDESELIISVGGGEFMVDILDDIDFKIIESISPKWFMGNSDNTNLTFLLPILCDVASIYGPNAPEFGLLNWHQAINDTMDLVSGRTNKVSIYGKYEYDGSSRSINPLDDYNLDSETNIITNIDTFEINGRLIGGCLDSIIGLIGTKFDKVDSFLEKYKEDGFIWFLEACDLNPLQIRRAIRQLDYAGYFKYAKGFIFGKPLCIGQEIMGINHINAVLDIIGDYNLPILLDADLGHLKPSMPIITGSIGKLEVKDKKYTLEMTLR